MTSDGSTPEGWQRRTSKMAKKIELIFLHLRHGSVHVKHGFSWPAFFFGSLWGLNHGLWLLLPSLLIADMVVFLVAMAESRSIADVFVLPVLALVFASVRGYFGNRMIVDALRQKGYFMRYPAFDPIDDRRIRAFGLIPVAVRNFHEAMAFYTGVLGFLRVEDVGDAPGGQPWRIIGKGKNKLLVVESPAVEALARERADLVWPNVPLYTDDCRASCAELRAKGLKILHEAEYEDGRDAIVAVFEDPFGNRWDLIQERRRW